MSVHVSRFVNSIRLPFVGSSLSDGKERGPPYSAAMLIRGKYRGARRRGPRPQEASGRTRGNELLAGADDEHAHRCAVPRDVAVGLGAVVSIAIEFNAEKRQGPADTPAHD